MDEDKAVKFLRCPSSDLVELAMEKGKPHPEGRACNHLVRPP